MQKRYIPKNKLRIATATSLFDGHDVSINIMRRIIQASGCEVVHLGHNRSVEEIVRCAIQEDVHAVAITSYQGGHMEFFKYLYDTLAANGAGHIRIFGGGGGTILPSEIMDLHAYGISRIYSPDDGRKLGLQGMIDDLLEKADFALTDKWQESSVKDLADDQNLARLITVGENLPASMTHLSSLLASQSEKRKTTPVLGITGPGGAGKSSVMDELIRRCLEGDDLIRIAVLSVDPTKRKTGGALLGDRIRMNAIHHPRIYMRSMATRRSNLALSEHVGFALEVFKAAGFDLIILESSGIGQSDTEIVDFSDYALYVMTPEYGAASQLEKIDMLDFADWVAINKFDKPGAEDAQRDVKKQYRRNRLLWDVEDEQIPVFGTIASQFNDPGMDRLYEALLEKLPIQQEPKALTRSAASMHPSSVFKIIPSSRIRYLEEIVISNRGYDQWVENQKDIAQKLYCIQKTMEVLQEQDAEGPVLAQLKDSYTKAEEALDPQNLEWLKNWKCLVKRYKEDEHKYKVRDEELSIKTYSTSLAHSRIPKVALPKFEAWGDLLKWSLRENVPGEFPFTAGVFPYKRENEDPTRMFAGEGGPERTNKRFHYLSKGMPATRLSTAFDSVTLYGEDPDIRPDIYGKIGNSGVNICTLDDVKKLYSGFDLFHPGTSVSMTINGPAAILTAFYLNAAIDQQCEIYIKNEGLESEIRNKIAGIFAEKGLPEPAYQGILPPGNDGLGLMLLGISGDEVLPESIFQKIKARTLSQARGTVQADILKEDQAQNTCIFSTAFSLKLMGDVQQYFVDHKIRNFYSVSVSGYHIAEAGANPITQLALTLSNGFTYVEYFLSRGMHVDDFAPNLSFFFSNGIDPEYAVIGRVARRIWAKAMKVKYGANERSQRLKYHIQTSGRSLHAQEIDFNDIRTTLQALYAIYDNCNSLHTNAFDEAITTPTEASVRRALAIQLIINKELGLAKNENPLQGSYIIEELTDLVEEAVYREFERISERGGVLGAMETTYQRSKIQEESMYFEHLKHSGEYPVIGVNTFLSSEGSPVVVPKEIIRSDPKEKENQIANLAVYTAKNQEKSERYLKILKRSVIQNENIFASLMEAVKYCSLGQITHALYEVGGQYRRNM
ncbi:methylmalonyl-CoA mutase family protein [Negadavirga shengliensis]|uniref:Fused isobutyryl-CoA mutase n=1 Tax=Negadavirga shengliensis TaxID=1389218 RepID=A0ABV9T3B0_9BACT